MAKVKSTYTHHIILPGSHVANTGNIIARTSTSNCMPTKGDTERQISAVVIPGGASPFIIIKHHPNGGVM